ncbi:MAG: hypothetical protein AABW46_02760 [Nanoarchaeota archaeon]
MKFMCINKKGDVEFDKIIKWLIALAVLVILIVILIAVRNKNENVLAIFDGIRNFGDLFK